VTDFTQDPTPTNIAVLNPAVNLFRNLAEVRDATYWWMIESNEQRPHDYLNDLTLVE
jgi:hypothetical protein